MVPWPISERAMRMITVSSGLMTTQALISGVAACALAARRLIGSKSKPSARPLPAAVAPTTNDLRSIFAMFVMAASSSRVGSCVDRLAHLLEGAAATDVGDRLADVGVGGLRLLLE